MIWDPLAIGETLLGDNNLQDGEVVPIGEVIWKRITEAGMKGELSLVGHADRSY